MPSAKTNAMRVGAFVVIGISLVIIALIYFGATDMLKQDNKYVTYFDTSVQGLNLDSPVKFRGVTIGKVTGMSIAPDGELIEVEMALKSSFNVNDSLGVQMNITGITGLRYLEVDFANHMELSVAPMLDFNPEYPVIPSVPGGFEELETALKSVYEKFMKVDTEGISYEAKEFMRAGTQVMGHADSIITADEFTAWVYDLNTAVANMEMMIAQLKQQQLADRLDMMMTELQEASIQAREGTTHLNNALETLDSDVQNLQLTRRADSLFANINKTFDQTSDLMGQSQYSISQVVTQLSLSVTELNQTLEQVNALLLSLEEYPGRVLYSSPPKKER